MAGGESVCNMQTMREWMREKMKRRTKRGPNNSESTGKIGQELPQNQEIAPLRPAYPDALPSQSLHSELAEGSEPVAVDASAPEPRIEVETQPDNVGAPPPEPTAMPQVRPAPPRLRRARHRPARQRQDHVVQAPQRYAHVERHAAQHPL